MPRRAWERIQVHNIRDSEEGAREKMEKRVSELTIDDLRFFKYPNLMAEVKETTYSICTIADHMGLPRPYRKENDPETWDKLTGKTEILTGEACGLARLFGVPLAYLFSLELKVIHGQTAAYWRWFDEKKKVQDDIERSKQIREIERELREKPYLMEFMKEAVTWNSEQLDMFIKMLEDRKSA